MHEVIPCFINPGARGAAVAKETVERDARFIVHACDPRSLPEMLGRAVAQGARRVLLCGGDGTLATGADVLADTGVEMAVLPCGTLNHFAQRHGIPDDVEGALEVAWAGRATPVDVGSMNGRTFLNTSTIGAYADFVRVRERWDARLRYYGATVVAVLRTLARMPTYYVSLKLGDRESSYQTPLVFVGVGHQEPALFATHERPDGRQHGLQVIVVRGATRSRILLLVLALLARRGRPLARTPHLDRFAVTWCQIKTPHNRATVSIDGELLRQSTPVTYELRPGALRLVVPAAAAGALVR